MTVIHHDDLNDIPVTPMTPKTVKFSHGMTPDHLGDDSNPVFKTRMRIDINHPGNDNSPYPIKALLTNLLKALQKVDTANVLLPIDDTS
jgi:hypothetical protein